MNWEDILKARNNPNPRTKALKENANREAYRIMEKRHGEDFVRQFNYGLNAMIAPYRKEYLNLVRLMEEQGMSPDMAEKQPSPSRGSGKYYKETRPKGSPPPSFTRFY
tara:strand:- start:5089 stop:5412 length:324 start_codon:yes stop_codon:yes gene_type:complete